MLQPGSDMYKSAPFLFFLKKTNSNDSDNNNYLITVLTW